MNSWLVTYGNGVDTKVVTVSSDKMELSPTELMESAPAGYTTLEFVERASSTLPTLVAPLGTAQSPNGTMWIVTVDDDGNIQAAPMPPDGADAAAGVDSAA